MIEGSAKSLAASIRLKQLSSEEVVTACLERIYAINPVLNAVVHIRDEAARREARAADERLSRGQIAGPLHGVPVTIKDVFDTHDMPSTAGTLGRANYLPAEDAVTVARLRAAGAIVMGKTNSPELALAYETDNLVYGRTNNPFDPSRTPGGSSGGEAAIIAAGASPLGLGTDTAGSIRVPAHFCGIVGIKPTSGRVPGTGGIPAPFGATGRMRGCGPMSRFVEDLEMTLPLLSGIDWRDPWTVPMPVVDRRPVELKTLRVAFYGDDGRVAASADTVTAIARAVAILSDLGASVENVRPPGVEQAGELFMGIFSADGGAGVGRLLKVCGTTEVHPLTARLQDIQRANAKTTAEFGALLIKWDAFRSAMLSFIEDFDVIVCPVCAFPALPHGSTYDVENFSGFGYAMTYNLTGWPAVVIRGGTSAGGLPVGLQIVAAPWREDIALAVAFQLEEAFGGWPTPLMSPTP